MHAQLHELFPQATLGGLLPQACELCVNDAGFQSGMAGAARCKLIEQSMQHAVRSRRTEWRWEQNGTLACAVFVPDSDY
jgi:hypothetical protein